MAEPASIFRLSKKDEHREELVGIIADLKGRGVFSRVMRDGIRLMWDLSLGNTNVLLELFPHIRDSLCPPPDDKVREDIADLKRMIIEQGRADNFQGSSNGLLMSTALQPVSVPTGNLKALGAKAVPSLPVFDGDDDELPTLILSKNTSSIGTMNFLAGFNNL